ncbi:hypothetical protein FLONG3_9700 [Fusarium longipes]|uniref:Uncharacterized protein n=1 Tax=Fusarium longipes TaxID=694270 RepID=A0A395RV60_9HYPO|nr:hypothetical protein FLONG3_9700 [Fusarium longipes]
MTQLTKVLIALAAIGATFAAPVNKPRQLGGEGGASDAIISDTDNASGYGVENALIHISQLMGGDATEPDEPNGNSDSGSGGGSPPPPPPPGPKVRMVKMNKRQLDKISNGVAAVLNAGGENEEATFVEDNGDTIDGQLTSDGTLIGQQIGGDEESIGEGAGNLVPNKMPTVPAAPAA